MTKLSGGVRGFFGGAQAVFVGLGRLIRQKDLRKLAVTPLLITVVTYLVVVVCAAFFTDDLLDAVWQKPTDWLVYIWYAVVPIIFIAVLAALVLLFVSIAGVISGPFYEAMVTRILKEHSISVKDAGLVKGAVYEISRSMVFLVPTLVCAVIGLIPVVGIPFVIVGTTIGWLGLASMAVNPALVATGNGMGDQISFVFKSVMPMIGVGMILGLSLLVPVLGLLSIPSAVIGVTELYAKALKTTPPPQAAFATPLAD